MRFMVNYVKRLIYVDEQKRAINPLFYPFLFATLIYGVGFLALGGWSGVNSSSLWTALHALHPWLPSLWGLGATLAALSATALLIFRKQEWLGEFAALFGFMIWIFAATVYAINGFWLVLLTVTIPNGYFWGYYYSRLKWYERQKRVGLLTDPQ